MSFSKLPDLPFDCIVGFLDYDTRATLAMVNSNFLRRVVNYELMEKNIMKNLPLIPENIAFQIGVVDGDQALKWEQKGTYVGLLLQNLSKQEMEEALSLLFTVLSRKLNSRFSSISNNYELIGTFMRATTMNNKYLNIREMDRLFDGRLNVIVEEGHDIGNNYDYLLPLLWKMQITDFRQNTYNFITET